jgi:hypothetical protein
MWKLPEKEKCKVKRTCISIAAYMFASLFSAANANGVDVMDKPITYTYKNDGGNVALSFPFLQMNTPLVQFRINNFLHLIALQIAPPSDATEAPVPLPYTDGIAVNYATTRSVGVALTNGGRVASTGYAVQGWGLPFEDTRRYEFDFNTGRILVKEEFLTPAGKKWISRHVLAERKARIRKEMSRLSHLLAPPKKSSRLDDTPEIIDAKMGIYAECLEKLSTIGPDNVDLHDPGTMHVIDGGLRFTRSACSELSIDDLGPFQDVLAAAQLKPYLSNYGRYILLGGNGGGIAPINPYAQVYRGTVGSVPITLFLGSDSVPEGTDFMNARYYYNNEKRVIELNVSLSGDVVELTETESKQRPKPVFRFTRTEARLKGEWRGDGKVFDFAAAP